MAGPVQDIPEVVKHPHTHHRLMVVEKDGYRGTGNPVKLSRTPASVRTVPPGFGAETRAVLAEAGYSPQAIDALLASGIAFGGKREAAE